MGVPPEAANRCVFSSILPAMTDAFSKLPIFWQLRSCINIDNLEESERKKERKKEWHRAICPMPPSTERAPD